MCLYTTKPAQIADKDIICYKSVYYKKSIFGDKLTTVYYDMKVKIGRQYREHINAIYNTDYIEVNEAFHSYVNIDDAMYDVIMLSNLRDAKLVVVKCIIPKGSIYYTGCMSLKKDLILNYYASDTIKYVKIISE